MVFLHNNLFQFTATLQNHQIWDTWFSSDSDEIFWSPKAALTVEFIFLMLKKKILLNGQWEIIGIKIEYKTTWVLN